MIPLPRREAPWAATALRELRYSALNRSGQMAWAVAAPLSQGGAKRLRSKCLAGLREEAAGYKSRAVDAGSGLHYDVGISLLMGGLTYLLASWSIGRLIQLRRPDGIDIAVALAALFAAWFCVDGVYVLYHGFVGNRMDREGNFRASLPLYFLAGMIWLYRGSLSELRRDLIRRIPRT